jgi:hypothetical protein
VDIRAACQQNGRGREAMKPLRLYSAGSGSHSNASLPVFRIFGNAVGNAANWPHIEARHFQ